MNHKFDIRNKARLKTPERRKSMPAEILFAAVDIAPGSVVVDIGCGVGFWSIPLAQHVGSDGSVYAVDVLGEMIEALEEELEEQGVTNIEGVVSEESIIPLLDACADVAFMSVTYHELEDRPAMLDEIYRLLKHDGRFINLDWKKKETGIGPPLEFRFELDELIAELEAADFRDVQHADIFDFYNVVWGTK